MTQPKRNLPPVLGEIALATVIFVGILGGVPRGLVLLLPAGSCVAAPNSELALMVNIVVWCGIALPTHKVGLWHLLRLGAVMLTGTVIVYFASGFAVGCTFVADWNTDAQRAVAAVTGLAVVPSLACLCTGYIEPRWGRTMGKAGHDGEDSHD